MTFYESPQGGAFEALVLVRHEFVICFSTAPSRVFAEAAESYDSTIGLEICSWYLNAIVFLFERC